MITNPAITILFVDNELDHAPVGGASVRDRIEKTAVNLDGLEILFATSAPDAEMAIRGKYVHAAIVDHDLGTGSYGVDLLRRLAQIRPSCRRVITTSYPEFSRDGSDRLYGAIERHPSDPIPPAHEFLPAHVVPYEEIVSLMYRDLWRPPLRIVYAGSGESNPLDQVFSEEVLRRFGKLPKGKAANGPSPSELQHVLNELFSDPPIAGIQRGHERRDQLRATDSWSNVELRVLAGGRSRATVFSARPSTTESGKSGAYCVVKVGPLDDMLEEVERYNRYVRLYRASARRVELIGACAADTLGGVCYSFAGGGVESISNIEELLNRMDVRAITYLREEFSQGNQEWFAQVVAPSETLDRFFTTTHRINTSELLRQMFNHVSEAVPRDIPGAPAVASQLNGIEYHSCIIHGDLNAGNLLVANATADDDDIQATPDNIERCVRAKPKETSESKSILIDYRHTARGPITIDFAALFTSIRLLPRQLQYCQEDPESCYLWEQQLWDLIWIGDPDDPLLPPGSDLSDYDSCVSVVLGRLVRRNFEDKHSGLVKSVLRREMAATCIYYAMRIFKIRELGKDIVLGQDEQYLDLSSECRLRLSIWAEVLSETLLK